jgi:acyl-CoA thioesterase-1
VGLILTAFTVLLPQGKHIPRVLIIGDSISMGYMKPLKAMLEGRAEVEHNPGNAQHSGFGLKNLDGWLGDSRWDVIHFNHGLHDLKYVDDNGKNVRSKTEGHIQIPLEQYKENMEAIVLRLKETGAKLIFATTTPYPDRPGGPLREAFQAERYNNAAVKIMRKHQVQINDLYAFTLPRMLAMLQPNNVHFTSEGSKLLADEVAESILQALEK